MEVCLGNRQIQHIRSLDICHFLEHGHQFRKVVEPGEPGLCPIAGTLRGKLNGGDGFSEAGSPGIEVEQVVLFQCVVLQIFLHGVHLHHRVGNGGACGKDDPFSAGDLVQVAALHIKVAGLLCFRLRNAAHIAHLGKCGEIFIEVGLVHKDTVNPQLLEGDKVILPGLVVQLLQFDLQRFSGFLHLLDGKILCPVPLGLGNAGHNLVDLLLQDRFLPFHRHRNLLKLAVTNDNSIIVTGGDSAAEFLSVLGFKVLPGCHKDIGRRI